MLWGAAQFLELFLLFRVCWIRGTLGGGKTLLSIALAEHLLKLGMVDGVVANLPNVLPSSIYEEDGTLYRRAIVFDEAWTELDSRDSLINVRSYGAYARKMGSYWIFPSVHPIDKRLRSIIVWRAARLVLPLLPTIWIYRWGLELDYDETGGVFYLVRPERFFGHYDTAYIPTDDGGIDGRWRRTVAEMTDGRGIEQAQELANYLEALSKLGDLESVGNAE